MISDKLIHFLSQDAENKLPKSQQSSKISNEVEDFIASGGKIETCAIKPVTYTPTKREKVARQKLWGRTGDVPK
jgi:hypothetical protein